MRILKKRATEADWQFHLERFRAAERINPGLDAMGLRSYRWWCQFFVEMLTQHDGNCGAEPDHVVGAIQCHVWDYRRSVGDPLEWFQNDVARLRQEFERRRKLQGQGGRNSGTARRNRQWMEVEKLYVTSKLPERGRVSWIARRIKKSTRTVRYIIHRIKSGNEVMADLPRRFRSWDHPSDEAKQTRTTTKTKT